MITESTSEVHGHWPGKYAVASIKDRGRWVLHAESPVLHAESSYILHAPLVFYMATNRNTSESVAYDWYTSFSQWHVMHIWMRKKYMNEIFASD